MNIEDLNISPHSGVDPCGHVFFYKGRILRAINPEAEQWVREFLSSELYVKLVDNGWFVRTWIAEDVQLDGYPLIVESERVYACQWQLQTFEQMREAAILAIKINELCKQYGWVLCDSFIINFGLKDGHLVYFDLGSFQKKEETLMPELAYLYTDWRILRLMSIGMGSLARSTKPLDAHYNESLLPDTQSRMDDCLELVLHPFGKKYKVFRKKSKPALFCFRTRLMHAVIHGINRLAERITKKPYPWRLFYAETEWTERDFERLKPYYQGKADMDYLGNDVIKYFICQNSRADSQPMSIMLYGEYRIEDLELLRNSYTGRIWVCSPHLPYTDRIYQEIKGHRLDIGVLSYNFSFSTIHDNEKIVELGIDGFLCNSLSITGIFQDKEPEYFLERLVNYFNQVYFEKDGACNKYIKNRGVFELTDTKK